MLGASHYTYLFNELDKPVLKPLPIHPYEYAKWTPERLIRWAKKSGQHTAQLIEAMIASRPHPQQAFRACFGVMRLGKSYGGR